MEGNSAAQRKPLTPATLAADLGAEALTLHTYGVLASIRDDCAGWIADADLDLLGAAVDVDTSLAELMDGGLWTRVAGGYRVDPDETLRMARVLTPMLEGRGDR